MHYTSNYNNLPKGFTLIEISIVLVIIGLIVGGVLVGQDLIKSAETRSIITDIERFNTAINTFYNKYNCKPGDCANATNFFDTDSSGCPSGGGATGTCNGDGDGYLVNVYTDSGEWFRAWQQLGLANLIAGTYSGVASGRLVSVGINIPASRVNKAGYSFYREGPIASNNSDRFVAESYLNTIEFGGVDVESASCCESFAPAITTLAAFNIDSKIDDGLPGTGKVLVFKNTSGRMLSCSTTDDPTTAVYNLTNSAIACGLIFGISY